MPCQAATGRLVWRTDLRATERHWRGWFEGMSKAFLALPIPKVCLRYLSVDGSSSYDSTRCSDLCDVESGWRQREGTFWHGYCLEPRCVTRACVRSVVKSFFFFLVVRLATVLVYPDCVTLTRSTEGVSVKPCRRCCRPHWCLLLYRAPRKTARSCSLWRGWTDSTRISRPPTCRESELVECPFLCRC